VAKIDEFRVRRAGGRVKGVGLVRMVMWKGEGFGEGRKEVIDDINRYFLEIIAVLKRKNYFSPQILKYPNWNALTFCSIQLAVGKYLNLCALAASSYFFN